MKNKMSIRIEDKNYVNFEQILDAYKGKTILTYYLVVNDEEVEITPTMAAGMAYFFDEYNQEVCKLD